MSRLRFATLLFLLTFTIAAAAQEVGLAGDGGWLDSAEAYFVTGPEATEWWGLKTDADKQAFIERYWLRRDPTPETPRNEFKELVEGRIRVANERFTIDKTPGSQTSRGMVFILFGSPAKVSEGNTGVPSRTGSGGEWSQVQSTWIYDRFRTPKLLELIDRPQLEVKFVITPSEKTDRLQDPGVVNHYRKTVADASIVTREVVVTPTGPQPMVERVQSLTAELPAAAVTQLNAAATAGPAALKASTFWTADAKPATLFWLTLPNGRTPTNAATLYGRVTDAQQRVVATVARDAKAAEGFTTRNGDVVYAIVLPLAPGTYDAVFALQPAGSQTALASGSQRVVVPGGSGAGFEMSSLLLTHDLGTSDPAAIVLGSAPVRPRADNLFATNESLWYAFQVASPTDPGSLNAKLVLRRQDNGKMQVSTQTAELTQTAAGSYLGGYEIPLETMAPGDYSLYLTLTDAAGRQQVRRADFKVVSAQ